MNTRVELLVNNTGSTAQGVLDMYGDEPITLNMAIANIRDIKVRSTTHSYSFVLPGTKNNNTLFNDIFNIGANSQFNPGKKTPCQLLVDTIPVLITGNLQLTGINVDNDKNITYEVSIFDQTEDLIDAIGDKELTDLDFSELNHIWSYSSITATWSGSSQSYFYPLIDYGRDWSVTNLNTINGGLGVLSGDLFPALQVKTILDKIFSSAGFTYQSDLFNSNYFKNLYIPFNETSLTNEDESFATGRTFHAEYTGTTGFTITGPGTGFGGATFPTLVTFTDDINIPNFDNGNHYNNVTSRYVSDTYSVQRFTVSLDYIFSVTGTTTSAGHTVKFFRSTYNGGSTPFEQTGTVGSTLLNTRGIRTATCTTLDNASSATFYPCQPNESFWVEVYFHFAVGPGTVSYTLFNNNTFFYNYVSTQILPNQLIDYNVFIPKKIKQIDFLNSLITMHNLYVIPSTTSSKTLTFEPRDIYYASGNTLDWTSKLDKNVPVKEELVSEQTNKRIIFTYASDSDFYNDDYSTITKKIFGDYYQIIDNDFTKDDKIIDIIFAPTPSIAVLESSSWVPPGGTQPVTANEFVIPKIGKADSNNNFGKTNFKIRILQKNPNNLIPLSGTDTWKLEGNTFNDYPYLGMLNHPFSASTDIAFGQLDYEYYNLPSITPNNLVNTYWQNYLNQISDKDSKLITASFYLTPADIQSFNFNDKIFADGLTPDGGHYFIVNSIEYTPTSNGTSKVELIKVNETYIDVSQEKSITSIYAQETLQSLNLAGGKSLSTGSIAIGLGATIGSSSDNSLIIGSNSYISSPNSFIFGTGSTIVNNLPNTYIFGNGISATTGNTLYTNNIILSSGGTINGFPISGLTGSTSASTLWISGSGTGSVLQNNSTGNNASGTNSLAIGSATTANGIQSYAEGYLTTAAGINSHSEGNQSQALGTTSHAEGASCIAAGTNTHAEGDSTTASGNTSHSEGANTITFGFVSHAEGLNTTTFGDESHAEGSFSTAIGQGSHAEGAGSISSGVTSHAEGNATQALGQNAHSEGNTTIAFGNFSHSEGSNTLAQGILSHAEGDSTTAFGNGTHSEGSFSTALGLASHAEGDNTIASGITSHSEGSFTTAIGIGSHSEGNGTITFGFTSHAEGLNTTTFGDYAHVGGQNSIASGTTSFVHGSNSRANGSTSIVFGDNITGNSANTVYVPDLAIQSEKQIYVSSGGTNPTAGLAVLVGGSKVVTTNKVTNNSIILITTQGGTLTNFGSQYISARTPGTSFTISSLNILDTSTVGWILFEQY